MRSDVPASGMKRRPVFERYLQRKHGLIRGDEPPTLAEISDAQSLLQSSWDDELREEALEVLRLAGIPSE